MNPVIRRSVVRQVVLGLVLGSAISVIPIEISLLGAGAALTFLCLRRFWIGLSIAWLVCFVAVQLPLHRLERKIGPFAYFPISVAELIQKLRDEQGVPLMVIDDELKRNAIVFSASSRVTRREVIERLAAETNTKLHYRGCGNGATLLFGSSRMAFLSKPAALEGAKVH